MLRGLLYPEINYIIFWYLKMWVVGGHFKSTQVLHPKITTVFIILNIFGSTHTHAHISYNLFQSILCHRPFLKKSQFTRSEQSSMVL